MNKIEEENKNLIALRNNYFAIIIVLSGGIAGLALNPMGLIGWFLFLFGLYLDFVFIVKIEKTSEKIKNNIRRI